MTADHSVTPLRRRDRVGRGQATAGESSGSRFRPEIEGLRTVAFFLVAIFHIWLGRVSGGVDVFFTVAGFLVTVSLLSQVRSSGRLRAGDYFGRLAIRLLPTAAVVLAAVLVLVVVLLPFASWRTSFEQVLASMTYWENWYLAFNAVDYLAVDTSRSPVQHFWAISVQGQFYVLWFVIFAVASLVAVKRGRNVRRTAAVIIGVAMAASLVWSVLQTHSDQAFAYFSTLTRVWEFGFGSLLALVADRIRLPRALAASLSWIALAAMVSIGLLLPVADAFPGYVALIPVLAACTIIVTSQNEARWGAKSLLASKPLVWLGGLGYGVYLWHWPVLIFTLEFRGIKKAGLETGLAIIVVSVVLAYLTRILVERPMLRARSSEARARRRAALSLSVGLAGIIVVAAPAGVVASDMRVAEQEQSAAHAEGSPCFGAGSLDPSNNCSENADASVAHPTEPSRDMSAIFSGDCSTRYDSSALKPCTWGDPDAEVRVALIGNSHGAVWFPAFLDIAEQNGWRLDTYFRQACTFNTASRETSDPVTRETCDKWNRKLTQYLADSAPYTYVLTSSVAQIAEFTDLDTGEMGPDVGVSGYASAWQPLIDRGATILAMRDYPRSSQETIDCAAADPAAHCARDVEAAVVALDDEVLAVAAERTAGAELVDMTRWFCTDGECPAVIGNVHVYRDPAHFTATYGRTLAEPLLHELHEQAGIAMAE